MILKALTLDDAEAARQWRNEFRQSLRTPFLLTEKMQQDFYLGLNGNARMRYFAICESKTIGMGGLVGIEWENRLAEISLILAPEERGKGYGKKAVELILHEGFNNMNLANIYGECYMCNPAVDFWAKICSRYNAYTTYLPQRKFWNGKYHDSLYFNIGGDKFGTDRDQKHSNGRDEKAQPRLCRCQD